MFRPIQAVLHGLARVAAPVALDIARAAGVRRVVSSPHQCWRGQYFGTRRTRIVVDDVMVTWGVGPQRHNVLLCNARGVLEGVPEVAHLVVACAGI